MWCSSTWGLRESITITVSYLVCFSRNPSAAVQSACKCFYGDFLLQRLSRLIHPGRRRKSCSSSERDGTADAIDGVHSATRYLFGRRRRRRAFFLPFEPVAPHQKCLSSPLRDEAREEGRRGASLWIIGSPTTSSRRTPPFSHTKCDNDMRRV